MNAFSYIVMDLEFNRPDSRMRSSNNGVRLNNEIVQIGAVKLDSDRTVIDRYSCFIKPTAYPRMSGEIGKITHISTEQIWEGDAFKDAYEKFIKWCGEEFSFVTWSENDIIVIEENLLYHGMDIDDLPKCYDIQLMFDDQISMNDRNMPLNYALWKLDITPMPEHDALNDALNTAEVFKKLDISEGLEEYEV